MKYAKVTTTEELDSTFFEEEIEARVCSQGRDIILVPNRDFMGFNSEHIECIENALNDIDETMHVEPEDQLEKVVNELFPNKANFIDYTREECEEIVSYVNSSTVRRIDVLCACMSLINGCEYSHKTLRGSMQSEWIECIFPVDTDREVLDDIEALYFGTGCLVTIQDGDYVPNYPDDIGDGDGDHSVYTSRYKDEDLKELVAKDCNVDPSEVVLWIDRGGSYVTTYYPKWEKVTKDYCIKVK